jgi:hypothetical protein
LLDVTVFVVLTLCPPVWPTTLIEKVQKLPPAIVPPERLTAEELEEAPAMMVPALQDPVKPLGVAIPSPAGRVSTKATPANAMVAFGFVIVKDSVVVVFKLTLAAPNAFVIEGGPITVIIAVLLVAPGPLCVEDTGPVILFATPTVAPMTFSEITHDALGASVPPERAIELDPGAATVVPPQLEARLEGVATTRSAGKVSVTASPVRVTEEFGLLIIRVSEVDAPARMLAAPNALVIVGAAATLKFAEDVLPVPPLLEVTAPLVLV